MANPAGESNAEVLDLFRPPADAPVSRISGHLRRRLARVPGLDDALGLSAMAGDALSDVRTGKNGRHAFVGMLRQSVFGRLAGYEDVNDAERLRHDPANALERGHER